MGVISFLKSGKSPAIKDQRLVRGVWQSVCIPQIRWRCSGSGIIFSYTISFRLTFFGKLSFFPLLVVNRSLSFIHNYFTVMGNSAEAEQTKLLS